MPLRRSFLLAAAAAAALPGAAGAAVTGDPDPTFSGDGAAVVTFPAAGTISQGRHAAVMPDGRTVVAGQTIRLADGQVEWVVTRLLPDGSRDPSFGDEGRVTFDPGETQQSVEGFALLPDGSVLLGGPAKTPSHVSPKVHVLKLDPTGTPASGWGGDGVATVTGVAGSTLDGGALAVDPAGRVYVGGGHDQGAADTDSFVARLTAGGVPDPAYGGGDGFEVVTAIDPANDDRIRDLRLHDGRLTAIARIINQTKLDAAVARWAADPLTPDTTFDVDGVRPIAAAGTSHDLDHLVVLPNGSVRVAGSRAVGAGSGEPFVLGLDTNGQPDAFGTVTGGGAGAAGGLAAGPGGTVYVAGSRQVGQTLVGEVRRLRADGSPDPAFGGDGAATATVAGRPYAAPAAVAVAPSGDVLAAGAAGSVVPVPDVDVAAFRFKGSDDPPPVVVPGPAQPQPQPQAQDVPPQQQPQDQGPPRQQPPKQPLKAGDVIALPSATACRPSGKLAFRLKLPAGAKATKLTVKVGSRRAVTVTGKGLRGASVPVKALPKGKTAVTVTVTVDGTTLTLKRNYRRCPKAKAKAKRG